MPDALRRGESSLVAFTVALQLACGLALAAVLAGIGDGGSGDAARRGLVLLAMGAAAASAACSVFHLGRPGHAWRSLANLPRSPLSLEVFATGAFGAALCGYGLLAWDGGAGTTNGWGIATVLLGGVAVGAGARVYTASSRPLWRAPWVTVSFFATTILFAACAWTAVAGAASMAPRRAAALLLVTAALLQAGSAHSMRAVATRITAKQFGAPGIASRGPLSHRDDRRAFILHLVLSVAMPGGVAVAILTVGNGLNQPAIQFLALSAGLSALAGATLGRRLMFLLGTAAPRF